MPEDFSKAKSIFPMKSLNLPRFFLVRKAGNRGGERRLRLFMSALYLLGIRLYLVILLV